MLGHGPIVVGTAVGGAVVGMGVGIDVVVGAGLDVGETLAKVTSTSTLS